MALNLKKWPLDEFYDVLYKIQREDLSIRYPLEVRKIQNGIGFKMFTRNDELSLYMYPNHPALEISIVRKGMRYIYPRRTIKVKKHNVYDLLKLLKSDDRLQESGKIVEVYIKEILMVSGREVFERSKLG
ncbi:hypothetical protein [Sphaerochaeta sp. S2]|uniref:hypothetical protein n=1 Tax=Sphaerochaeta sp. S2 TaxID=2798868 RepID=UPI0018EA0C98|nr:hypothetical protein [Sphaerochaeta sp. S2]MBJ2356609.1 hypothetical protein [Sphaerochaeta sp. S2]